MAFWIRGTVSLPSVSAAQPAGTDTNALGTGKMSKPDKRFPAGRQRQRCACGHACGRLESAARTGCRRCCTMSCVHGEPCKWPGKLSRPGAGHPPTCQLSRAACHIGGRCGCRLAHRARVVQQEEREGPGRKRRGLRRNPAWGHSAQIFDKSLTKSLIDSSLPFWRRTKTPAPTIRQHWAQQHRGMCKGRC